MRRSSFGRIDGSSWLEEWWEQHHRIPLARIGNNSTLNMETNHVCFMKSFANSGGRMNDTYNSSSMSLRVRTHLFCAHIGSDGF